MPIESDACIQAPTTPFAKRFGDGMRQVGASIAVDRHGYPVVSGAFHGALDLGVATLNGPDVPPPSDVLFPTPPLALEGQFFAARLAPTDCTPFARTFEGIYDPLGATHVALSSDDSVLLTATYIGVVDFGGGSVNAGPTSTAIVKFTASGNHVWSHAFGASQLIVTQPATDAQGNVYTAGFFSGWLSFDNTPLGEATSFGHDGFVAKLDSSGALVWWKMLALDSSPVPWANLAVTAWPNGDVAVGGQIVALGSIADLGGGPVPVGAHQTGFVTSFDASGQHRWQKWSSAYFTDAQIAPSGDLVAVGLWDGFGIPIQRFDKNGKASTPVVIDAPGPRVSLAVGPNDEVLITAPMGPPTGGVFAAMVAASGKVLWTRTFDSDSENGNYRVDGVFGPSGTPFLAGGFMGTMDFGTGSKISADGTAPDVFVVALPP